MTIAVTAQFVKRIADEAEKLETSAEAIAIETLIRRINQ